MACPAELDVGAVPERGEVEVAAAGRTRPPEWSSWPSRFSWCCCGEVDLIGGCVVFGQRGRSKKSVKICRAGPLVLAQGHWTPGGWRAVLGWLRASVGLGVVGHSSRSHGRCIHSSTGVGIRLWVHPFMCLARGRTLRGCHGLVRWPCTADSSLGENRGDPVRVCKVRVGHYNQSIAIHKPLRHY